MASKVSRRNFIKLGGMAAAVATSELTLGSRPSQAQEGSVGELAGRTTLPYPRESVLADVSSLQEGDTRRFFYPDEDSPCILIKMGRPVPGGVGPDKDLVAYSTQCSHQGCPLSYDPEARTLQCHCHFSIFDPELSGRMVCGQATVDQPQIALEYDEANDAVYAVAVKGLIYGRQANIL